MGLHNASLTDEQENSAPQFCVECGVDCADLNERDRFQFSENEMCWECNDRGYREYLGDAMAASRAVGFCGSV